MRENNYPMALRVLEGMCLELPHNATFFNMTAKFCLQMGENEKANFYLRKANEIGKGKKY
jgi:Flp pilus assembly protein TadD